jgi:hypothetical protein
MDFEMEFEGDSVATSEKPFAVESDVKIWVATDYSKFVLNEFNRDPSHYRKVLESIQANDYTQFQPILVDRKMNIVDGQNRFLACRELGLPIYFIVSREIHIFAAADINQASKNWSMQDYVQHYSKRGKDSYTKMLDLCAKYNQRISVIAQFGKITDNARSHTENVKKGNFQFRDDLDVDAFFEHLASFQKYYKFSTNERFVKALLKMYMHKDYSEKTMTNKLRLVSGIVHDQPSVDMMLVELLKLYNYKSRSPLSVKP